MKSSNTKNIKRSCPKKTPGNKLGYPKSGSNSKSVWNPKRPYKNRLTELDKITVILAFTFL